MDRATKREIAAVVRDVLKEPATQEKIKEIVKPAKAKTKGAKKK